MGDHALVVSELRAQGRFGVAVLALSLVFVEFLAGMQRYLSQTVLPLAASDLEGAHLYGPLNAAAQAPMFLMMPIGAWLMSRFKVGHLMATFTMLTVAGAVVCAAAPSMFVFIAGTAIRAAASGALATVGMGAVSRGLPPKYRQLVLGGMSGIWVFSSVLGPVYAVAASQALGWRWAMLLYLPLLLAARLLIGRYTPERTEPTVREKALWGWSLVLAAGSILLSVPLGTWSALAVVAGCIIVMRATAAILPAGTYRARDGRRAALAALTVTAAVYFGASIVLSVVAHDTFGLGVRAFGFIIAAPGFTWAIAGLWTGSHPAPDDRALRRRLVPAGAFITLGVAVIFATTVVAHRASPAFGGLLAGAALLGVGMGSLYPDLLGRCLTPPDIGDGISQDRMAASVVLAETVGMAISTTIAFAWLGTGLGLTGEPVLRAQLLYLGLLPLAVVMLWRLSGATRPAPTQSYAAISTGTESRAPSPRRAT
jgi:MFS family permease